MGNLSELRERIFQMDNKACFIERERIVRRLFQEMEGYEGEDRNALALARLLAEVSTPIEACDYFAGRVVEAPLDEEMEGPDYRLLWAGGHMSFDYEKVLRLGLKGILAEIEAAADRKGDAQSISFARNARIVVEGVDAYAKRYAEAAGEMGRAEMAKALSHVPYEPAYDFYSALQSIWMLHMIASCYVGSRDYAFGRFDQYLLPYYEKALADGQSEEALTELLAGFLIKANEICGRTTHNHQCKPVLCHSSKQYVNIGGETPNVFSTVVLKAAMRSNLAQPQIVVLLKPDADEAFTSAVFEALSVLTDKMNIYNYDSVVQTLLQKGIPEAVAKDFTYSACCTFDLNYHTIRREYYVPVPQLFVETLHQRNYESLEDLCEAFRQKVTEDVQVYIDESQMPLDAELTRKKFLLDSLLLSDSAVECRYPCDGTSTYNVLNLFCSGVATIGDSLMVLDKLVFREKRYTYPEFMDILKNDYVNHEALLREIKGYTLFGNDSENDTYVRMAGEVFLDAVDACKTKENFYTAPSFYSLERDNSWSSELGATPNGRKAGEPFSENQSPSYGADKKGITALLKSVSKLPFDRTFAGGLNLTFSVDQSPDTLRALVSAYFRMGGIHVGITVLCREQLEDAMEHPEKYPGLTVRLYGFSEYFVSLPRWQQVAVLNRTAY